jgi:hypothetical protein
MMAMKRRMTEREGKRETRIIWTITIVIVIIIGIALYGYMTGAWERAPTTTMEQPK